MTKRIILMVYALLLHAPFFVRGMEKSENGSVMEELLSIHQLRDIAQFACDHYEHDQIRRRFFDPEDIHMYGTLNRSSGKSGKRIKEHFNYLLKKGCRSRKHREGSEKCPVSCFLSMKKLLMHYFQGRLPEAYCARLERFYPAWTIDSDQTPLLIRGENSVADEIPFKNVFATMYYLRTGGSPHLMLRHSAFMEERRSLLHIAAYSDTGAASLRLLLSCCAMQEDGCLLDGNGYSPLHYAVKAKNARAVRTIVHFLKGAVLIDKAGPRGRTPLHCAGSYGSTFDRREAAIIAFLLRSGADRYATDHAESYPNIRECYKPVVCRHGDEQWTSFLNNVEWTGMELIEE